METERQKKISTVLQKDLITIIQRTLKSSATVNTIISVTKVSISADLMHGKAYISVFPFAKSDSVLELILSNKSKIKNSLGGLLRSHLRRIPEILFFIDDSLEHIDKIDVALQNKSNPIKSGDYKKTKK